MSLVDLGKSLLEAAKRGDTDEVRTLMSNGAPFTTDWLGTSPLHFAAQYGHISTAEVLLRAGISRDARTKVDRTPLHVASQEGHIDIVELLVKNGADIEAKDMLKMTPLHWSVEKGHVPIIQTLLQHGADIHCENKFDKSSVEIAVYNGRADLVDLLQDGTAVTHIESTEIEVPTAPEATIEEVAETMTIDGTTSTEGVIIPEGITPVTIMSDGTTVSSGNGHQDSTSVLATLAALAEASGPMNSSHVTNTTAAEALSWLEQHGITMISSDAQTIVSPSDSQTITLTEAGKLALKYIKEQEPAEGDEVVQQEELLSTTVETMVDEDGQQRVITIVADQNLPPASDSTPVVIMPDGEAGDISVTEEHDDEPVAKRLRLDEGSGEVTEVTEEGDESGDQDELRRQLEEVQKQAAAFKEQLKVKEEEALQYKKQLSEIGTKTSD